MPPIPPKTTKPRRHPSRKKPVRRKKKSGSVYRPWWLVFFVALSLGCLFLFVILFGPKLLSRLQRVKYASVEFSMPRNYEVYGIDVSRYQGAIDWDDLLKPQAHLDSVSIDFIFIKATEGKEYVDPLYQENLLNARRQQVPVGVYHFYRPHRASTDQALHFMKQVALLPGDLPPVLDIEVSSIFGADNLRRGLKNWLTLIEKHYGVKPIIYTNRSFYQDHLEGEGFDDYVFWIAHYGVADLETDAPWRFWQYTDKARLNGIDHPVDMNVFKGSREQLQGLRIPGNR